MNGYCNLESSPPVAVARAANGAGGKARRSLELTNTKETKPWEGLAIGAVTLARTFSTGSQRFRRSGSQRSRGGLPGALRRAFSMRRPPAGPGVGDGYWRIHDMDGDSERGDDTLEERSEEAEAEDDEKKKNKQEDDVIKPGEGPANAAVKEEEAVDANIRRTKKKRGGIFRACKKLLRL
ncbi:hypothetical protein PR202_gb01305 [Eleusine coracana subsp. coracana]|uniref:Uncharacterized protein n=1 Tax=Eleusine coracana subsp. coracana TaxID=191504 RepID=A0AAV5DW98_ELECO|nr:hypothetical protein QOZ80_5BG0419810 [Eleusine coracana subsp. coracana]GJN14471.1 hypothetical protein PR202_gb01305 [Eleusine coracana subsp. coracana]